MPDDLITIRLRLTGGSAAAAEARAVAGSVDGISGSTAAASTQTSKFRSALSSVGRTIAYSSIPVIGALGYEIGRSVNAYREARKVSEETNARIKSTGGIANVTATEVERLAETLSLKTGVDDEAVQAASNYLLSFKEIRNEVGKGNDIFNQATEAALDLAAANKTDGVSAARQLGKALNDPVTGLTAMRRAGVSFNEEQTKTIQKLFESGKQLKAQKMILKELSSEFAGTAKSQHDAVDKLGVAWENLEEKLGEAVYPVLRDVTVWLTKSIRQAQKGKGPLIDIKEGFEDFGIAVKDTVEFLNDLIRPMKWILSHADDIANIVGGGMKDEFTMEEVRAQQQAGQNIEDLGAASDPRPGEGTTGGPGPQKRAPVPRRRRPRRRGSKVEVPVTVKLDRRTVGHATAHAWLEEDARA